MVYTLWGEESLLYHQHISRTSSFVLGKTCLEVVLWAWIIIWDKMTKRYSEYGALSRNTFLIVLVVAPIKIFVGVRCKVYTNNVIHNPFPPFKNLPVRWHTCTGTTKNKWINKKYVVCTHVRAHTLSHMHIMGYGLVFCNAISQQLGYTLFFFFFFTLNWSRTECR